MQPSIADANKQAVYAIGAYHPYGPIPYVHRMLYGVYDSPKIGLCQRAQPSIAYRCNHDSVHYAFSNRPFIFRH